MEKSDGSSNIHEIGSKPKLKSKSKVYFGVFDARDSSLVPLQIVLFVFAIIEIIQATYFIVDEKQLSQQHVYAHLGSYMLAYASALIIIAFRPARARGLLLLVSVATIGFISTSILDIIRGNADTAGELTHVTKLIGPFIVWIIAKRVINFSVPGKPASFSD
jgi:hypothetical protein